MKTLFLRPSKGAILNEVADAILDEKEVFVAGLEAFELIEGPGTAIGSGEQAIIEITLRYDDADPDTVAQIKEIIELAKRRANEIVIEFK